MTIGPPKPLSDLIEDARAAMDRAHAPYSGFHVGACVRTFDGALFSGCNVENAAYPQGWCAETSAIAAMVAGGAHKIADIVIMGAAFDPSAGEYVTDTDLLCTPCGGCRQKIREFATPETRVHVCTPTGVVQRSYLLDELLPDSFGPANLEREAK